jgi:hypothetical protein
MGLGLTAAKLGPKARLASEIVRSIQTYKSCREESYG